MEGTQSTPEEGVDVIAIVRSPEFAQISDEAMMLLAFEDPTNHEAIEVLLGAYDTKLSEIIEQECGEDSAGAPSKVSGTVYGTDREGYILPDPLQLTDEAVSFEQVSFAEINGKYVVVFIFETSNEVDAGTGEYIPEHFIYAEPASLTKFELYNGETEPFLRMFHLYAEQIREEVTSEVFYALPFEAQKARLLELSATFHADIIAGIGPQGNLELEAAQYAYRFDDVQLPIEHCVVVQAEIDLEDWNTPEGRYVAIEFPELEERTEAFRSIEDFSFAKGSACVVLHDVDASAKYYVPADEIGSVTANYFNIGEQSND